MVTLEQLILNNSFCKEFAGETCDGIALLMDLLRTIQMAQVELNGK